jgi:hypothetical protein
MSGRPGEISAKLGNAKKLISQRNTVSNFNIRELELIYLAIALSEIQHPSFVQVKMDCPKLKLWTPSLCTRQNGLSKAKALDSSILSKAKALDSIALYPSK